MSIPLPSSPPKATSNLPQNLQKEIEDDTGIRFGIVEKHQFAAIPVTDATARPRHWESTQSEAIWTHLKDAGYVDARGKVQDHLRKAIKDGTLQLPEPFQAQLPQVTEILRKLAGKLDIKNADERRSDQDPPGGAAQRGVQGAVEPHQA